MNRHAIKAFTLISFLSLLSITTLHAREPRNLLSSPLAEIFGSQADLRGARLSPDGIKASFIQMHPAGMTVASVFNLETGENTLILSSEKDNADITWCQWANNDRLLCSFRIVTEVNGDFVSFSRLVAVNADGSEYQTLLENQMRGQVSQFQDDVIDWLPDDPEHILITLTVNDQTSSGVGKLDIYTGRAVTHTDKRNNARTWISDGSGEPRMYQYINQQVMRWYVRDSVQSSWEILSEIDLDDLDEEFSPAGFGDNPDELLIYQYYEGRNALFSMNLKGDKTTTLVYSHPEVDIAGLYRLGKHKRLVAVSYVEQVPQLHFFDDTIADLHQKISDGFPGSSVSIIDEDWNQRYYLIFVQTDTSAGTYYRFDTSENSLMKLAAANAAVNTLTLSHMDTIVYPARDSVEIPAYLSLPNDIDPVSLPTVILPHGGPSSRDILGYDFLVQFLTANGYAVLQSNYRGSTGYGKEWEGDGAFKGWRQAIDDITDGGQYLIDQGIADPERICVFGWSYGGYAALMSVIEEQQRYQCVISIAGVTDPGRLGRNMRRFVGGQSAQTFIGTDDEVVEQGSPVFRVEEINVPVLLIHAKKDINVPFSQSRILASRLDRKKKEYEFVEYNHAEHNISPERYRIDLLTRLGTFLEENL